MLNPRLATRYAKSLLDLSIEKDRLDKINSDVRWLETICRDNPELVTVLRSPVIKGDKKEKILDAIFHNNLDELTMGFIRLMIRKGREMYLPEVLPAFITQYKTLKKIFTIRLRTVTPVSEELKEEILRQIRSTSEMQTIELETSVDESLIGGFVLEAGDQLVDASIAYDLKNIARQFENNDFIYKIR